MGLFLIVIIIADFIAIVNKALGIKSRKRRKLIKYGHFLNLSLLVWNKCSLLSQNVLVNEIILNEVSHSCSLLLFVSSKKTLHSFTFITVLLESPTFQPKIWITPYRKYCDIYWFQTH